MGLGPFEPTNTVWHSVDLTSEFWHATQSSVLTLDHTLSGCFRMPHNLAVYLASLAKCIALDTCPKSLLSPKTLFGCTITVGGRSAGILGWMAFRLKNTVKMIASREWQLVKHDIEEFVTPAWVNQEKQRAEYLSRIARAERRMGRVRHACLENLSKGLRDGDRGQAKMLSRLLSILASRA